jgi:hypothetical protein
VYRYGIAALALAAGLLLAAVGAHTAELIPLYAIGVFLSFTLSQCGLVRHWHRERPHAWQARAVLNASGAAMTAIAVVVFLVSKFVAGAWVVVIAVPLLMLTFSRTEGYYRKVAQQLKLGKTPPHPRRRESVVIVPTSTVSLLTERAVSAALSLSETVVAVAVAADEDDAERITREWDDWGPGVPIEVLVDPHRSLVRTVLRYIKTVEQEDPTIIVLIPIVIPSKRRHEIFHNQRGRLLETVLKARANVVIATLPFHVRE